MPIRCEIVSQDRIVYQGDAEMVLIPGADGIIGILPKHSSVLTTLKFGIITVKEGKEQEDHHFTVAGGVAEVQPDLVTILADAAEDVDNIDIQRAEAAKQRAEEILQTGTMDKSGDEYFTLQTALKRSQLRLDAVRRYRQSQKHMTRSSQN
jgi:F-type H+-transporting ATPase subunit epsilon